MIFTLCYGPTRSLMPPWLPSALGPAAQLRAGPILPFTHGLSQLGQALIPLHPASTSSWHPLCTDRTDHFKQSRLYGCSFQDAAEVKHSQVTALQRPLPADCPRGLGPCPGCPCWSVPAAGGQQEGLGRTWGGLPEPPAAPADP